MKIGLAVACVCAIAMVLTLAGHGIVGTRFGLFGLSAVFLGRGLLGVFCDSRKKRTAE